MIPHVAALNAQQAGLAPHLGQHAPEPYASRREQLLQQYRLRFADAERNWDDADLAAYDWICALGDRGHVGAQRLRDRMRMSRAGLQALARREPSSVEPLVADTPLAARALVLNECAGAGPRFTEIRRWLTAPGRVNERSAQGTLRLVHQNIALAIGEVAQHALLCAADGPIIARLVEQGFHGLSATSRAPGEMLLQFARRRLASDNGEERAQGERLLERAADLRCGDAQDELFARRKDPAIYARWLDEERAPAVAMAVQALQRLPGGVTAQDMEYIASARYLGLAQGPGAVPEAAGEPYAARFFYELAQWRQKSGEEAHRKAAEALFERGAELGSRRAQLACYRRDGDVEALSRRVERCGEGELATEIRRFATVAGALGEAEIEILARHRRPSRPGELLYAFAKLRGDERLLQRAAALGSLGAKTDVAVALFERAGDKRAFVKEFVQRYPRAGPVAQVLQLRLGAALEGQDLDEAITWYAAALDIPAELDARLSFDVACAFDRRYRMHRVDDPARALAWHRRAIGFGNRFALESCIEACVKGEIGLSADPDLITGFLRLYSPRPFPGSARNMVLGAARRALLPPKPSSSDVEREFWHAIKAGDDPDDFELYLQQFPSGSHAREAHERLHRLRGSEPPAMQWASSVEHDPARAVRWLEVSAAVGCSATELDELGGALGLDEGKR